MKNLLTELELQQFDEVGCATIDTPLTTAEIEGAAAAMDRLMPFDGRHARQSMTCSYDDPAILEIIQHPFFEEIACQALRAKQVHFFQTAIINTYPEPDKPFSFWQHVDMQYRLRDFQTVPRTLKCSFFLWLSDVNERRAPMMVRPGSHLQIAAYRENDPDWADASPRVVGVSEKDLPDLGYAEPVPLLAKCGQVSVLTTSTLHGASVNVDNEVRRCLVFTFAPAGLYIGLPPDQEKQKISYHRLLRQRFRSDRLHLLPEYLPES